MQSMDNAVLLLSDKGFFNTLISVHMHWQFFRVFFLCVCPLISVSGMKNKSFLDNRNKFVQNKLSI